jgi:hypothetical protein
MLLWEWPVRMSVKKSRALERLEGGSVRRGLMFNVSLQSWERWSIYLQLESVSNWKGWDNLR